MNCFKTKKYAYTTLLALALSVPHSLQAVACMYTGAVLTASQTFFSAYAFTATHSYV